MRYVTIAYGPEKWKPLAQRWLKTFDEVIGEELIVVSDGTPWVNDLEGPVIRHFDNLPKVHGNLNTSGVLLALAAFNYSPCMVVTLDVKIQGKPEDGAWMDSDIALGLDPANRSYPDLGIAHEYNCAVQWCGASHIGAEFIQQWDDHLNDPRARSIPFWEQVIWSRVWNYYDKLDRAAVYPKELNWSHWWGQNPDAKLIHYHGRKKWDAI